MSFSANVFRILIASPSDVVVEREIAVRTIQEWNDLNSAERQIVLLPLRWETHSAPEYGKRPQEVINRQVVDHCDLLVGIFWTRIGSPTGVADGGTVEEIERVAREGKPVMLYFSRVKEEPDKFDLEQLAKLREFKAKTFPKALVESYGDQVEFKEKLAKQIEIQLRELIADSTLGDGAQTGPPVTDIVLHLADLETGADAGSEITLERVFVDVQHPEKIPDYVPQSSSASSATNIEGWKNNLGFTFDAIRSNANPNYYRQKAVKLIRDNLFAPIRFWLKNNGSLGARDVFLSLTIRASSTEVAVLPTADLDGPEPSKSSYSYGLLTGATPLAVEEAIPDGRPPWTATMDIGALQPQRELSRDLDFAIGATEDCDIEIDAQIFADTLAQPKSASLRIKLRVRRIRFEGDDFFEKILKDG